MSNIDATFELLITSCIVGGIIGEYAISQQWSSAQVLACSIGGVLISGIIAIHSLFVAKKRA